MSADAGESPSPELAQARITVSPPCAELGMRVMAAGPDHCRIEVPAHASLSDGSLVHSAALTVLIDTAAGVLAGLQLRGNATLDLRIDHIRPAPIGGVLQVDADIAAQSPQWVTIRSRVHADDITVAESIGTFIRRVDDQGELLMKIRDFDAPTLPVPAHADPSDFRQWLDVQTDDEVYVLPYSSRTVGHPLTGHMHGGVVAAFLETAALLHLQRQFGNAAIRSINTTTAFHRYAGTQALRARVHLVRSGKRVAAVRVDAWQADESRSTAQLTGHFLVSETSS